MLTGAINKPIEIPVTTIKNWYLSISFMTGKTNPIKVSNKCLNPKRMKGKKNTM